MFPGVACRRWIAFLPLVFLFAGVARAHVGLPDFTGLVADNAPAVVNISTSKQVEAPHALPPSLDIPELPEDHPLGDLLRRFFGEPEGGEDEGDDIFNSRSLGSGFVLSPDGYIVTNHHVVKDADEIIVKLSDRRELVATLVGSDPRSDIALLKVEATGLPALHMGSSDTLKPGEWVLAIGSPFGFDHSVTAGIVSAKGRSLPSENYVPFIQTDVAINPGNSGGPLFNLDGEVVGINSQIYSRTGGFMGLSFAIPVEVAMNVVEQLKTRGYVSRGWLGVYIQEVTRELAESFGMSHPTGALVAKVIEGSPSDKAGLRVGDVILSFNDVEVPHSAALPPMVGRTPVGEKVTLKIMREGHARTVKLEIGELPEEDVKLAGKVQPVQPDTVLGMELGNLTAAQREQLGIDSGGVVVRKVFGGPAQEAGVRKGDVLLTLNNRPIKDVDQFRELAESLPAGKFARLFVNRDQAPAFMAIRVPE